MSCPIRIVKYVDNMDNIVVNCSCRLRLSIEVEFCKLENSVGMRQILSFLVHFVFFCVASLSSLSSSSSLLCTVLCPVDKQFNKCASSLDLLCSKLNISYYCRCQLAFQTQTYGWMKRWLIDVDLGSFFVVINKYSAEGELGKGMTLRKDFYLCPCNPMGNVG